MTKRGGPGDLKSQIGSFLRSTLQQLDNVREVVVQKTKASRMQLDVTLLKRKRKDALAKIGEVVARLADAGRIDEEDFPELSGPLAELDALDERIAREERRARAAMAGAPIAETDAADAEPSDDPWRRAAAEADDREEYDDDEDLEDEDEVAAKTEEDADEVEAEADEPDAEPEPPPPPAKKRKR